MSTRLRVDMFKNWQTQLKVFIIALMKTGNGYRKLCKRYNDPGHGHYLTFSCFQNQPFLNGNRSKQWLIDAINTAREKYPFDLWAWVIMPEHVHLLLYPHEGVRISQILYGIKKPVSQRATAFVRRQAPYFLPRMLDRQPNGQKTLRFWQRGGGYDRNIFSVQELHEKITYIHKNPIRRNLAANPEEWTWSSWRGWEEGVDEPLRIDRDTLPPLNCRS